MDEMYLVTYTDGNDTWMDYESADEIFQHMDVASATDRKIVSIYFCVPGSAPVPVSFHGKWCCDNPYTGRIDPLRMEIRLGNKILDFNYGNEM